jgi:CYTH domain-containing protein
MESDITAVSLNREGNLTVEIDDQWRTVSELVKGLPQADAAQLLDQIRSLLIETEYFIPYIPDPRRARF